MGKQFISSSFKEPFSPTEEGIREAISKHNGVTLYGFPTMDSVNELLNKFPKYVKPKYSRCSSSTSFEEYGITDYVENRSSGYEYHTHGLSFHIMNQNGVTGELNETGIKRLNKYIDVMKKEGYIS